MDIPRFNWCEFAGIVLCATVETAVYLYSHIADEHEACLADI